MLLGDLRGKWRECDPYLTSDMISSVPQTVTTVKTSTQVRVMDDFLELTFFLH